MINWTDVFNKLLNLVDPMVYWTDLFNKLLKLVDPIVKSIVANSVDNNVENCTDCKW